VADSERDPKATDLALGPTVTPAGIAHDATVTPNAPVDVTLSAAPRGLEETIASVDASEPVADTEPLPEVSRDAYVVERELARGGMGRILIARDRRLGRRVALKELLVVNPALAQRFAREVRVTARLQHPSIVPVYEAGRWPNGEPFYAMKLVTGRSLEKVVRERPELADRLRLVPNLVQLAEAMAYAHDNEVIHRDLKPANVLIGDYGETVVIDWGLAKRLDESDEESSTTPAGSTDLTVHGAVVGTPAYMPPEQARGEPVDARADVYALGALMWHVLAGRAPVSGTSMETILSRVREGVATTSLAATLPDVPAELATIVDHAMQADPAKRYPSARELAEDLRRFQGGRLVATHRYSSWELVKRWVRRHRAAVIATTALVVTASIIGVIAVRQVIGERNKATAASLAGFEEQGRRELIAGRPQHAASYLAAAYRGSHEPSDTLRMMLAEAMRPFDLALATWKSDRWIRALVWLDDDRIAAADDDGSVVVWDTRANTHREIAPADERARHPRQVVASDDGRVIAVLGDRALLIVGEKVSRIPLAHKSPIHHVAISPAGDVVAIAGRHGAWTFHADGTQREQVSTASVTSLVFRGAKLELGTDKVHTCGDRSWVAEEGDLLFRVDASRRTKVGVGALQWVACARKRALGGHQEKLVVLDDSGIRVLDAPLMSPALHAPGAIDHEGTLAAVGTPDGIVTVWSLESGLVQWRIDAHTRGVDTIGFARTARRVATTGEDGFVRVWRVDPERSLRAAEPVRGARASRNEVVLESGATLRGHDELVSWIGVSDAGDFVTAGARDGRILRWDTRSGEIVQRWQQPSAVSSGALAGDRFAIGGADGTVRIWGETKQLAVLGGHTTSVWSVAWSPDRSRLLTAADTALRMWSDSGELLQYLPCEEPIERAWWLGRHVVVAGARSLQTWDIERGVMILRQPHGTIQTHPVRAVRGEPLVVDRVGWNGIVSWPLAREERDPPVIDALVASGPGRLVDGRIVPALISRKTAELVQAGTMRRTYDFSGDTFQGDRPDALKLIASDATGTFAKVRAAMTALERTDRATATAVLAGLDETGDDRGDLALAWCRHWLRDDAAAYAIARRVSGRTKDDTLRKSARSAAFKFAAWGLVPVATVLADVAAFGGDEARLRYDAGDAYAMIGRSELAIAFFEAMPATAERGLQLSALVWLARLGHWREEPIEVARHLEIAATKLPAPPKKLARTIAKCRDVPVSPPFKEIGAAGDEATEDVAALTFELAAAYFSTFEKTFDHRYALAARRLYKLLAGVYGIDANAVANCEGELDQLSEQALLRDGSIDKAVVRRAFKSQQLNGIAACHDRAVVDPEAVGTIVLRFVMTGTGGVDELDVTPDSDRPVMRELAECIRDRMTKLRVPRRASGDRATIVYPLRFTLTKP
jgi:WD40 repeat protein